MKYIFPLFILVLGTFQPLSAQLKFEREYRLKSREVPPAALEFMQALPFTKKIRWYREEGYQRTSIEAKTKHQSKRYSIEFDTSGQIEDVEVIIKWKNISAETRQLISKQLGQNHQRFRVRKVQIQYTGTPQALREFIAGTSDESRVTIRYELIVKAKTDGQFQRFEYLFSEAGEFIKRALIIDQNSDHLEF